MTLKNTKIADIIIKSRQKSGGELNETSFETKGTYCIKDGIAYIAYKEPPEIGTGGASVLVKAEKGIVTVRRNGDFRAVMPYCCGKSTEFVYRTPYGGITMTIHTSAIHNSLSDNGGELELHYRLISGGEHSDNDIYFRICAERNG